MLDHHLPSHHRDRHFKFLEEGPSGCPTCLLVLRACRSRRNFEYGIIAFCIAAENGLHSANCTSEKLMCECLWSHRSLIAIALCEGIDS